MPRGRQAKDIEEMRKKYIEAMRWRNREQALLPLQNIETGKPGDRVLYQSLIVRFENIWIKKLSKILDEFPKNTSKYEGYTKQELINDIKNYELKKAKALAKLGGIVYEPVIAIINEQEQQEQQEQQQEEDEDGDVVMSDVSVGGKKRRKSRRRKRTRKRRKSRRRKRRR